LIPVLFVGAVVGLMIAGFGVWKPLVFGAIIGVLAGIAKLVRAYMNERKRGDSD